MRKISIIFIFAIVSFFVVRCSSNYPNLEDGIYAEIETNRGTILLQLEMEKPQ